MNAAVSAACIHKAFSAGGHSRPHHGTIGTGMAVDNIHPGKAMEPLHIKRGLSFRHMHRQGAPAGMSVIHIAQRAVGRTEGVKGKGISLCHISGSIDGIIHHDQHPFSPGGWMGCQTDGIEQVHGPVCADSGGRTHGPCKHQGNGGLHCQLEKPGRLLHGIGAMNHHKAIGFPLQLIGPFCQRKPDIIGHILAVYGGYLLSRHLGEVLGLRQAPQ